MSSQGLVQDVEPPAGLGLKVATGFGWRSWHNLMIYIYIYVCMYICVCVCDVHNIVPYSKIADILYYIKHYRV